MWASSGQLDVCSQCEPRIGVSEPLLYLLHVLTALKAQARARVAKGVEAHPAESDAVGGGLEPLAATFGRLSSVGPGTVGIRVGRLVALGTLGLAGATAFLAHRTRALAAKTGG